MTAEELLDEPDRAPARIAELVVADPDATTGAGSGALQRRDDLTARAESYARGARAQKTWAAYERQWARFESWCQDAGEAALPAAPLTVVRFLADLAPAWRPATPADPPTTVNAGQVRERDGLRPGTLAGYLAAISVVHQSAGLDNPTRAEAVRRTMAGIRRHPGVTPPRRRAAARRDPLLGCAVTGLVMPPHALPGHWIASTMSTGTVGTSAHRPSQATPPVDHTVPSAARPDRATRTHLPEVSFGNPRLKSSPGVAWPVGFGPDTRTDRIRGRGARVRCLPQRRRALR